MTMYMTARWKCRQGAEVKVRDALAAFVESIKGREPGTRLYTALQSADDPTGFMTYFVFDDDEARDFHRSTEWVKRFTDTIYPENEGDIEFTEYRLIDSTDMQTSEAKKRRLARDRQLSGASVTIVQILSDQGDDWPAAGSWMVARAAYVSPISPGNYTAISTNGGVRFISESCPSDLAERAFSKLRRYETMSRVSTYLNFPRSTEQAFNFYRTVFGSDFAGPIRRFSEIPAAPGQPEISDDDKNLVMHVELPILGGHVLRGTDAPESMGFAVEPGNNVYINLEPDTRADTDRLFAALSENGKIEMPLQEMFWGDYFGSLTDQFGVKWMFNCTSKT